MTKSGLISDLKISKENPWFNSEYYKCLSKLKKNNGKIYGYLDIISHSGEHLAFDRTIEVLSKVNIKRKDDIGFLILKTELLLNLILF